MTIRIGLLIVLGGLAVSGCLNEPIDLRSTVGHEEPVSFENEVLPLLMTTCGGFGCHVGESTSGVDVSSYAALMGSTGDQYGEQIVKPENAFGSPLVDKIQPNPENGSRMPFARGPLRVEEIDLIVAWIEQGADNN